MSWTNGTLPLLSWVDLMSMPLVAVRVCLVDKSGLMVLLATGFLGTLRWRWAVWFIILIVINL